MLLRILIIMMTVIATPALAGSLSVSSGTNQVGLLELYTSEGCSSCPPADRWITGLGDNPDLWREFVPVAFHVDYWDYIGWKDRFASSDYTKRQRGHAREQGMRTIYTPGFFYNGAEWRRWRGSPGTDLSSNREVGPMTLEVAGRQAQIEFTPLTAPDAALHANVALLGFDLTTKVRAGENTGRELTHNFVVLGVEKMTMSRVDGKYLATLPLPAGQEKAPRYGVAAWVSPVSALEPLQAVGGWLSGMN